MVSNSTDPKDLVSFQRIIDMNGTFFMNLFLKEFPVYQEEAEQWNDTILGVNPSLTID